MSCVSQLDALWINGLLAGSAATSVVTRVVHRVQGVTPAQRKARVYAANAALLASMGIDPEHALGPAPSADGSAAERARTERQANVRRGLRPHPAVVGVTPTRPPA